jgi:chromosomal replication initiation ATPase DnaA
MLNLTKPARGSRPELRRAWSNLMAACTELTRQWIFEQALEDAAMFSGCSRRSILGRGNHPKCVRARWACWWMLREVAEMSYPEIGVMVGRDHSTVIHALRDIRSNAAAWSLIEKMVERQTERSRILTAPVEAEPNQRAA